MRRGRLRFRVRPTDDRHCGARTGTTKGEVRWQIPTRWPATDTEMRVARASLFAAQAIARRLIADGREEEVQEIRDFISTIVPDSDKT